jgi:hypothetical protein
MELKRLRYFSRMPHNAMSAGKVTLTAQEFKSKNFGRLKGNEPSCVAFLSPDATVTIGQKMEQNRLKLRKTRKQMALELRVSPKTLWGWETDRWQPTAADDGTFF